MVLRTLPTGEASYSGESILPRTFARGLIETVKVLDWENRTKL